MTAEPPAKPKELRRSSVRAVYAIEIGALVLLALASVSIFSTMRERAYGQQFICDLSYSSTSPSGAMIHFAQQPPPGNATVMPMVLAAFVAATTLMILEQFTIRDLLIQVLLVGAVGLCGAPASRPYKTQGWIEARYDPALPAGQMAAVKKQLRFDFSDTPQDSPLRTMVPSADQERLRNSGMRVDEVTEDWRVGVRFAFLEGESIEERERLGRVYLAFFEAVTTAAATAQGMQPIQPSNRVIRTGYIEH